VTAIEGRWVRLRNRTESCRDCAADQAQAHREGRVPPRRRTATWQAPSSELVCEIHKTLRVERGQR